MMADDLAWDYTAEHLENTPLLDRMRRNSHPFYSSEKGYFLTREQTVDLLHNLQHSTAVLKRVQRNYDDGASQSSEAGASCLCSLSTCTRRNIISKCAEHILAITLIFQLFLVVLNTALGVGEPLKDQLHVAIITVSTIVLVVNFLALLITHVKLVGQTLRRRARGSLLVQSFFSTVVIFAGLNTLFVHVQDDVWLERTGSLQSYTVYVVSFLKMLYFSISLATLNAAGDITANMWFACASVTVQMLFSYGHLLALVSFLLHRDSYRASAKWLLESNRTEVPERSRSRYENDLREAVVTPPLSGVQSLDDRSESPSISIRSRCSDIQ